MFSKIVNIIVRSFFLPCFCLVASLFVREQQNFLFGTKLHSRTSGTAIKAVSDVKAEPKLHIIQKFATKLQGIKTNFFIISIANRNYLNSFLLPAICQKLNISRVCVSSNCARACLPCFIRVSVLEVASAVGNLIADGVAGASGMVKDNVFNL